MKKRSKEILTSQKKAEKKYAEKRKGTPTFSAVRFNDDDKMTALEKKSKIESIIEDHGGTREKALTDAFECLSNNISKYQKKN
ncbi:hypothetical protein [Aliikangiella maris]|uniref:Uncharacterized protein n=2 Tax=Aliikangiella maris TaxID=3162458 RepID=A0ABV3MTV4_9GAMM